MRLLFSVVHWGCLLGVALIAPVSLPAGGAERRNPEIRQRERSGPFLLSESCVLRSSPYVEAPSLSTLEVGTPLRILRCWHSPDGNSWLQVKIPFSEFVGLDSQARRGWVSV